jgi:uncharacterized C2H2 Zn-finger protein
MEYCGQCGKEFKDYKSYLTHTCEVTGVVPTDPKTMGEGYELIQEEAMKRG